MIYGVLAELTMFTHFAFLLFVAFGGLLVFRWRWVAFLHVPAFLWGALISFMGWICPLTPLENRFLRLAGRDEYDAGFIEHYIVPVLYPSGLTRTHQLVMGLAVLAMNGSLYTWILIQYRTRRAPGG